MSDPFTTVMRVVLLLFVPVMIFTPLGVTLLTPNRPKQDSELAIARTKTWLLVLMTLLAVTVWLGLQLASLRVPDSLIPKLAQSSWVFFFPLWFIFGVSAIRARNPNWGAFSPQTGSVRTATITNRENENPIHSRLWVIATVVSFGFLTAIAARGLMPFPNDSSSGQNTMGQVQWIVSLASYASALAAGCVFMPMAFRRLHVEPEPLDVSGSVEMVELYRGHRQRKIRGLFWLLAVALPGFVGAMFCAATWLARANVIIGTIGAIGGTALGITGAVFGCLTAHHRMQIAEVKAKLDEASLARDSAGVIGG